MCDSASEYSNLLILLDDYSQAHVNGSQNLKQSFWGLYKARRHKGGHNVIGGGGSVNFANNNNTRNKNSSTTRKKNKYTSTSKSIYYSPHDLVREEFSATARILDNCDDDNSNNAISSFELFDTFEYENKNTGDCGNATTSSDSGIGLGLRQRKGKKKNTPEDDENKGTTTHHQEEKNESREIEKQKLNPIHVLFGEPLPPRDLRLAQIQAIQSLEGYVKAANRLQQIGLILDKLEKQQQEETGKE